MANGECMCSQRFTGQQCEHYTCMPGNPGSGVRCASGGKCNNGTCVCMEGYYGINCGKRTALLVSKENPAPDTVCAGRKANLQEHALVKVVDWSRLRKVSLLFRLLQTWRMRERRLYL